MTDPTFPALHGRPARGWINDPNGLSRFDGRYHVFFQHNPETPVHQDICWGHVSSTDLLAWRQEPVALRPRPGEVDAAGCWSGCLTDDDGTPTAVYTAAPGKASEAWATLTRGSADLRTWTPGPAVTQRPDDPAIGEVRDPFVFRYGDHRYVVQGAGRAAPDGQPVLLVYRADDLEHWQLLGPLLTNDHPLLPLGDANIWECPNLFPLAGRWVLLISLWRADPVRRRVLVGVRYLIGDLDDSAPDDGAPDDGAPDDGARDPGGLRFVPQSAGELDLGPAFYAPQVLLDDDRVLLWGWSWELDRTPEQVQAAGWAGSLTFPRELDLRGGELVARPAAELTDLRRSGLDPSASIGERSFELTADRPIGLRLRFGDHERPVIDPAVFGDGPARILVDGSMVEAYGTRHTFTTRAYPTEESVWLADGATEGFVLALG